MGPIHTGFITLYPGYEISEWVSIFPSVFPKRERGRGKTDVLKKIGKTFRKGKGKSPPLYYRYARIGEELAGGRKRGGENPLEKNFRDFLP